MGFKRLARAALKSHTLKLVFCIRARVGIKHFEINYAPAAMKRSSRTTDAQQLKGKKMRNKKMGKKTNPAEFDKRIQPFVSNVVQVMLKDLPAECDT